MEFFKNHRFVVTGGSGFLGKHVINKLIKLGVAEKNIVAPSSIKYDLRQKNNVEKLLLKNDIVIHLAANVGGLGKGLSKSADYFYDNAMMSLNIIKTGNDVGIKKFIGVGSILQYPDLANIPFNEKNVFDGFPSGVTAPYALGKNVMLYASNFFESQFNFKNVNLILPNLYGPGDDFNPSSSHVVASLIYKINKANLNNEKSIKVWGSGNISREFLFVKDAAEAICLSARFQNQSKIINIGSGSNTSLKTLTNIIARLMNFSGKIEWETNKQVGKKNNQLDVHLAMKELNFKFKTSLETGIKDTIKWYYENIKKTY